MKKRRGHKELKEVDIIVPHQNDFFLSPFKKLQNPKSEEIVKTLVSGQVIAHRRNSRSKGLHRSSNKKPMVKLPKMNADLDLSDSELIIRDIDRVKRGVIRGHQDVDFAPCLGTEIKKARETKIFGTEHEVLELSDSEEELREEM